MSGTETQPEGIRIPGVVVDEVPSPGTAAPVPAVRDATVGVESAPPSSSSAKGADPVSVTNTEDSGEKKKPSRGSAMAAAGQPVGTPPPPPDRPAWPAVPRTEDEMYVPEEFDVTDLTEVSRQLNRARARLFRVSHQLKIAQRTLAEAQSDYDRAMRRELVTISGGTEASRRAMAEIRCEPFENRIVVGKQIVEEWRKRSMDCRDDLKAIENVAHNVRAQIDIR